MARQSPHHRGGTQGTSRSNQGDSNQGRGTGQAIRNTSGHDVAHMPFQSHTPQHAAAPTVPVPVIDTAPADMPILLLMLLLFLHQSLKPAYLDSNRICGTIWPSFRLEKHNSSCAVLHLITLSNGSEHVFIENRSHFNPTLFYIILLERGYRRRRILTMKCLSDAAAKNRAVVIFTNSEEQHQNFSAMLSYTQSRVCTRTDSTEQSRCVALEYSLQSWPEMVPTTTSQ